MAAIPVVINNATITNADGSTSQMQTIQGDLSLTGLSVGGGPIIPPDVEVPPDPGTGQPPVPQFPIVLPPGTPPFDPSAPGGYPPMIGGGPVVPEDPPSGKPPLFVPVWHPDIGWIVIPAFPVPTPSLKRARAARRK